MLGSACWSSFTSVVCNPSSARTAYRYSYVGPRSVIRRLYGDCGIPQGSKETVNAGDQLPPTFLVSNACVDEYLTQGHVGDGHVLKRARHFVLDRQGL